MEKYQIGITAYDNDHELWETYIGNSKDDGSKDQLLYSVWGKSETLSKIRVDLLVSALSGNRNIVTEPIVTQS